VEGVRVDPGGRVSVTGRGPLLARVGHALVERGLEPADLRVALPSLEDAYLKLTGDQEERGG
jgi:ABC-2 type transport system ATP-binding protein